MVVYRREVEQVWCGQLKLGRLLTLPTAGVGMALGPQILYLYSLWNRLLHSLILPKPPANLSLQQEFARKLLTALGRKLMANGQLTQRFSLQGEPPHADLHPL